MELTGVKGVGQSAAGKLGATGIRTVEDLAEVDQRETDVTGLSQENVARLRGNGCGEVVDGDPGAVEAERDLPRPGLSTARRPPDTLPPPRPGRKALTSPRRYPRDGRWDLPP